MTKASRSICGWLRKAESALRAAHFHIAELAKEVSRLELEHNWAFGGWIARLRGPSDRAGWLGFLDLSGYDLWLQNIYGANFIMSRLEGTELRYSILADANLEGAILEKKEA